MRGTQFNGLSEAVGYGDDYQGATNYPLVRITNTATGHVFYCRTHNHSTMGVATGATPVSTQFDVPPSIETGPSTLVVVANGIASNPWNLTVSTTTTQTSQKLTFGALSNVTFGVAPFPISAAASSGLPVTFISTTTGVCTVSGSTVTIAGAGTCSITASQAGNTNYAAATPVTQSFLVNSTTGAPQTITFGPLSSVPFGAAPFAISATASSDLTVSFASTTPGVCTVSGSIVTIVAAGLCSITASQPGSSIFAAAIPVTQTFTVSAPPPPLQLITVAPCRIMDTRTPAAGGTFPANSTFGSPYAAAGTVRAIPIPSSSCGVPASAMAYSLNFTVVPRAGKLGSLAVWPTGQTQPNVSTLTSPDGSVLAAVVNQIRGLLLERGLTLPKGRSHLDEALPGILADFPSKLSDSFRVLLAQLKLELDQLTTRVEEMDAVIQQTAREDDACRRLTTIPGVGPVTATALVAAIGTGTAFRKGRDLAAWVGIVPREYSSGGKQKLLGISKRGNSYLRRLFVQGARSVLMHRDKQPVAVRNWLAQLSARAHQNVVIVALANKLLRTAWAVLCKNETYRIPVLVTVA